MVITTFPVASDGTVTVITSSFPTVISLPDAEILEGTLDTTN